MWWMPLAMMGTGLLTSQMNRSAQADAQKANAQAAAAQTQFSPYTKMGAGSFRAQPLDNPMNGAMTGAASGLALSQNYNMAKNQGDMIKAQTNYYNKMAPSMLNDQEIISQYSNQPLVIDHSGFSPYAGPRYGRA